MSRRIRVLTTSRIGSTTRRSCTRLLRSSKLRRWTLRSCGPVVEQQVLELLDLVVERLHGLEVPVDHQVQQPVEQRADAVPVRSTSSSQRAIRASTEKPSSRRTVTSGPAVMNAWSSSVTSRPLSTSRCTA